MTVHEVTRCGWCLGNELMIAYHDQEWGLPVHDDRKLFEMLTLEGAQAGLNWMTVLRKREGYRQAFERFDITRIAQYGETEVTALLANAGIIRNRRKIEATITNARAALAIQREFGSLDAYLWRLVGGAPIVNRWQCMEEIPACSAASDALSKELQARGFRFVGSTICYAFMQAVGMVNDHVVDCYRYGQLAGLR